MTTRDQLHQLMLKLYYWLHENNVDQVQTVALGMIMVACGLAYEADTKKELEHDLAEATKTIEKQTQVYYDQKQGMQWDVKK